MKTMKMMALPLIAAAALMGCAVDGTRGAAEADNAGVEEHATSEEPVGSTTQALAVIDTDAVRITDPEVDFGGSVWGVNAPVGSGTLTWSVVNGFYTPRLTGTLHMKGADGKYARMHITYRDAGGNVLATRHGGIVQASGNSHESWAVDLSPVTPMQIVEADVCTELSDDGVDFPQVGCGRFLMN